MEDNIIELKLTEGTELEFQVALVDSPAIESDFLAFKKHQQFKVVSEDKRIISGFFMMAEKPIYRRDEDGREYYVKFTADSIRTIQEQFQINKLSNQVNINHETNKFLDGVYVLETFIVDESRGVSVSEKMYGEYTDKSWFGSMKVENDEVWESVKNGTFKGFSVEGIFDKEEDNFMVGLKQLVKNL